MGAASGTDEAGVAQDERELLEMRPWEVVLSRDLGEAGRPAAVVAAELDHEPDAVLTLRRERDRAGPVEARSVGGCGVRGRGLGRGRDTERLGLRERRGQRNLNPYWICRD